MSHRLTGVAITTQRRNTWNEQSTNKHSLKKHTEAYRASAHCVHFLEQIWNALHVLHPMRSHSRTAWAGERRIHSSSRGLDDAEISQTRSAFSVDARSTEWARVCPAEPMLASLGRQKFASFSAATTAAPVGSFGMLLATARSRDAQSASSLVESAGASSSSSPLSPSSSDTWVSSSSSNSVSSGGGGRSIGGSSSMWPRPKICRNWRVVT